MEPLLNTTLLQKLDRLSLYIRQSMAGDMQGERRSPRRGSSVEFADFRPYTAGDDIRQIDWNLYARLERLFLKLFVAEEELTVHLLVDTSSSMDWGDPNKLHYARQLAGVFGYITLNSIDRVTVTGFGTPARSLPGVRGKRGIMPLFSFLQNLTSGGSVSLAETCSRYAHSSRTKTGPLILCSDLFDTNWKDAIRSLQTRGFEITLFHILAPQEIRPQLEGDFRLVDSEGGKTVEITADSDILRRYEDHLASWRTEIESFCSGRGITYLFVDTASDLEEMVLSQIRSRGVVRVC